MTRDTSHPARILRAFLCDQSSIRGLRLFAVACCRAVADLIKEPQSWHAIEVAERFAEGGATQEELDEAFARAPSEIAAYAAYQEASVAASGVSERARELRPDTLFVQMALAQCIFKRCELDLTPSLSAFALAQRAYDERNLPNGHVPSQVLFALGHELEQKWCTDETLLGHLRCDIPHVRGCFAVEQVRDRRTPRRIRR